MYQIKIIKMFNRTEVRKALRISRQSESQSGKKVPNTSNHQDSLISLLIHDIFGGEILKTHKKNGWHFYNRINGERVDFSKSVRNASARDKGFDDLPATIDEPCNSYEMDDYSTFLSRFINAFEVTIGLEKHQISYPD